MKAIMDQRRVGEQLCDTRNVGLPHIGRNWSGSRPLDPPEVPVAGLLRCFCRVRVPHQGPHPVQNQLTTVAYLWPR